MKSANGNKTQQPELFPGATEVVAKPKKSRAAKGVEAEHLPPNLGQPVPVKVPDFSDPKRPKTCLEVDFPIVPINALSTLEGNAGKPIYQMSKWWARRRSCVFRAMLIAAAMEAPPRKDADGKPLLDENGVPIPDETEAAKAVWDVHYANHQQADNFKHLKVLDCFMGGGTTLVEGSRLGFQVTGIDLNPVAWFIVKNELACTDPEEVKRLFDRIEAEVKPQIQPFYVTDCPRGHKGKWLDVETGKPVDVDPTQLTPEDRKKYRYAGPEVIYTFWAKHGPCIRPECNHRTPIFRSPVVAEKELGVKYIELTCKKCKTTFHAELGSARIAPSAEHVVLESEYPYTALSQPFAKHLMDYAKGDKAEKFGRIHDLCDLVEAEPGLKCPSCGEFAGQWLRDVLKMHRSAARVSDIDKKHLKIQPPRNGTKSVYCYLVVHPDWLKGSPGTVDGHKLGGYTDAPVQDTAAWYKERLKSLKLIEVRGRIKLSEDVSHLSADDAQMVAQTKRAEENATEAIEEDADESEDRKQYGLPKFITLRDGSRIDTRRGTVPKRSTFACGNCGQPADVLASVVALNARERQGQAESAHECASCRAAAANHHPAPVACYLLQCYDPIRDAEGHPYGGRYFKVPDAADVERLVAAEREWVQRKDADLAGFWPQAALPHVWTTHGWALPEHGYTHWHKMFNARQLLIHALLMQQCAPDRGIEEGVRLQGIGAIQQYLRNQNMFVIWDMEYDKTAPFLSNPYMRPRNSTVECSVFTDLGRGNWRACLEGIVEGVTDALTPTDTVIGVGDTKNVKVSTGDHVKPGAVLRNHSSSNLPNGWEGSHDLAITDPPFGENITYADLSDFFFVWLRLVLKQDYPEQFGPPFVPQTLEAISNPFRNPGMVEDGDDAGKQSNADAFYLRMMTECWAESCRVLKPGGILAFTFHHDKDETWTLVLRSLFDAGFYLEATYPVVSDESKGETAAFGAQKIQYDIIHVCRKRLEEPEIRQAAELAAKLLRDSLDKRRTQLVHEQGFLFDDLDEVA